VHSVYIESEKHVQALKTFDLHPIYQVVKFINTSHAQNDSVYLSLGGNSQTQDLLKGFGIVCALKKQGETKELLALVPS